MCLSSRFQANSPEFQTLVLLSQPSFLSRDTQHVSTGYRLSLWPVLKLHLCGVTESLKPGTVSDLGQVSHWKKPSIPKLTERMLVQHGKLRLRGFIDYKE